MSTRLLTRAALVAAIAALCAPASAGASFSVVPSPNAFSGDNMLNGVSASSATDAWAVGSLCCSIRNSGTGALLEHWDGSGWTAVLGPDARLQDEILDAVADISPSDAWAVGVVRQSGYGGGNPLILHWDGSSWQTVAPPTGVVGEMRAVSGDMAGGAWVVGDDGHGHPVVLRCGVGGCVSVSAPQIGTVTHLRGVTAFAPDDAWAVGDSGNMTLAEHWDGAAWSAVASPDPDSNVNVLNAVAGVGTGDVWAVGRMARNEADTGVPPGTRNLATHWDGSAWNAASTPNLDDQDSLAGVAATNPTSVTAVGAYEDRTGGGAVLRTLGLRWNGSSWETLDTPNVGTADNLLRAAAAIPGTTDVWAVGEYRSTGPVQTLVVRDTAPATATTTASAPVSQPAAPTDPAPATESTPVTAAPAEAAQPPVTCGPARLTLTLGKKGLRARRITISGGGMKRVLVGPRRRLTLQVPYTGVDRVRVTIRIRDRHATVRRITRIVALCLS